MREFPGKSLSVSAGKLFCTACREVSLKLSIVKGHIKAGKHIRGKEKMSERGLRERDIIHALKSYDKEVHPSGETVPDAQRVFRVEVARAFMRVGVPLNKVKHFRELFEKHAFKLGDDHSMRDLIPFIFQK